MQPEELLNLSWNHEAEQAVLGAVFLQQEVFDNIESILQGEEFSKKNARIYRAMKILRNAGNPIDFVTVTAKLREGGELDKAGGIGYISNLSNSSPTVANVEYWAGLVLGEFLKRSAILETQEIFEQAKQHSNTTEMIESLQAVQNKLADRSAKGTDFKMIMDVCLDFYEHLEIVVEAKRPDGVTGIASGFQDLDKLTTGFQNSDLLIVAARPSVGKTAFALNVSQHAAIRSKLNVAIFSLEMGARSLVQRMICAEANVDANRMRTGMLEGDDWERIAMAISLISESNIFIDDTPSLNVSEIRAKCRRLKKDHGVDMILIDYIQLISGGNIRRENRQQEVSEISRILKQIARELNVPVIALSQLSRGVEQRQDKRPMMSDLRESGAIEQDADLVAFLYRDDYYDKESEKKNIIEIIIAKQRNGPIGTVELAFLKNYNKFVSLDRSHHSHLPPKLKNNSPKRYSKEVQD
ncbi:replicative DNA helicase [Paenibacillus radicis (ex Xue et al. 2023)]|uniref:Replicative DNA helicase n=1 Tax=Paenibacillus radicis (ex Xue et al. 2023) TaxID=2972489 RepID=A0ABT1YRH9_9BACL|nr:replicative DNA helicase [Paenibacillus radicis (ex Xue et al. 2023)]MCR8635768.1 replicative DNA helicase [Paenibacillus radicis (ex Xue et al. 2023)]